MQKVRPGTTEEAALQSDLIFDIGLHEGQDTEFYLKKGFRVVAVEADEDHCKAVAEKFADAVADGRLTIVNKALAKEAGTVTFYKSAFSVWSTLDPEFDKRNRRQGMETTLCEVEATTMADLLQEFGVPYYIKLDIEGLDVVALQGLRFSNELPAYISMESEKDSFRALRREFEILEGLGYDEFKIVPQQRVWRQQPPRPALEGVYVPHRFEKGSSGMFGEEAPGQWMSSEEAIEKYKRVFLRYVLVGDDPYVPKWAEFIFRYGMGIRNGWYDTHARIGAKA
ncbi:FkbM family methyltransferase [Methylocystis heyeri]|uniref:FkbM family methyltransferase n=1 Tax=Methylocystis heyeri TaxID=391905 RepID=A0A6B8KAN6_9HYPH|nr:FkbM family methyltransferase [Methylocystis heyeri]